MSERKAFYDRLYEAAEGPQGPHIRIWRDARGRWVAFADDGIPPEAWERVKRVLEELNAP